MEERKPFMPPPPPPPREFRQVPPPPARPNPVANEQEEKQNAESVTIPPFAPNVKPVQEEKVVNFDEPEKVEPQVAVGTEQPKEKESKGKEAVINWIGLMISAICMIVFIYFLF